MFEDIKMAIEEKGGLTKLFLDYDGTLVEITSEPELAVPSASLLHLLGKLKGCVPLYIVTGRDMDNILSLIGGGFNVIALHGAQFLDESGRRSTVEGFEHFVQVTSELAKKYADLQKKFPGLRIIDKGGGLQFHYFNVPGDVAIKMKKTISEINEEGFEMYGGKFVYELRIKGVNKGKAIRKLVGDGDFVLVSGDDNTDEEAFVELNDHITIKVGEGRTNANFRLESPSEMIELLSELYDGREVFFRGEKNNV
jgi:trehalose 6-phosphate phosphatase